jgi:hypothetical protein
MAGLEIHFRKEQKVERGALATVESSEFAVCRHEIWMNLEMNMRIPTKTLAAAFVAAAVPFAVPAAAAPLSQPLALDNANAGSLDQVQHRRHYRSGWNAFARSSRRLPWNYGNGGAATAPGSWRGCPGGDRALSDAYPSYLCR